MSRFALVRFVLSFGVLPSVLCLASFAQSNAPLVFVPAGQYSSDGPEAAYTVAADLNRDGILDLIIANSQDACYVGVLMGNGDGTFKPAVKYFSGAFGCFSVAVGDLNGDGIPDIAVANWQSSALTQGAVSVLLGNGDGTFKPAVTYYPGGEETLFVAIADVNGDGKPDLVVTNNCGDNCAPNGNVGVLFGNGDGTFKSVVTYSAGAASPMYPTTLAVADVNGDGHPDIVVGNWCPSVVACTLNLQVAVLLNNGDGTFGSPATYSTGSLGVTRIVLADVNGDGNLDIVLSNVCGDTKCSAPNGKVSILWGSSGGTFSGPVTLDSGAPGGQGLAIADVNGDGKLDLVVTHGCENDSDCAIGQVSILSGNGDGTFQPATVYDSDAYTSITTAVGDFNGDGKPDLAVTGLCPTKATCANLGVVNILFNNQGHATTTTTLASSLNPAILLHKVTYTATVAKQGGGTATGTITFKDGGSLITSVPLVNNQATYSTSYKTIAAHVITATYSGEFQVAEGSISSTLTEYAVGQTITTIATSGSPSVVGQPVTFSTTVTSKKGSIPDGELVTFYDGRTVLASVPLSAGRASFTTSTLTAKTHIIKAKYAGDTRFSTSSASITQVVEP